MPTATAPAPTVAINGRTTEDILREIVAEGKADPRIVAIVARFDKRAAKKAAQLAISE